MPTWGLTSILKIAAIAGVLTGTYVLGFTRAESHYKLLLEQKVAQDLAAIAEFQQKMATEILRQTKVSEDAYADRDARVASIQSDLDRSVADLARMRRAANAASANVPTAAGPAPAASGAATASGDVPERDQALFRAAALAESVRDAAERCQQWAIKEHGT